jgi:hypothetical protein
MDARVEGCCDRSLGGEAFGDEPLARGGVLDSR